MENWITVISFTYPHEAHLVKGKLESEGFEVIIKDELTAQVNNFYSNAIGGVKLLVKESDYDNARKILLGSGYIIEHSGEPNRLITLFDKLTSRLPLIGKSIIEFRLIILVALTLFITIVPIVLLSLPSTIEKLTAHSWCVDKIYYKGQELTPYTHGLGLESAFYNCTETMDFRENGDVDFPGINSYGERDKWEFRNDSLIITAWPVNKTGENPGLSEKDTIGESYYEGAYSVEIKNNVIKMQSDSLTIIGQSLRFNY